MAQQVLSITQLNEYIRGKLDADSLLNGVAVRGEISNYKLYPSGHHYFTLKDESSALKCVMFKGNAARLRFRPGQRYADHRHGQGVRVPKGWRLPALLYRHGYGRHRRPVRRI